MNAAWEAFKDKREKIEIRERPQTNIQLEQNDNLAKCHGFVRGASESRLSGLASTIGLSTRFWDLAVSNWPDAEAPHRIRRCSDLAAPES